jgi:hypothetical protein
MLTELKQNAKLMSASGVATAIKWTMLNEVA